VLLATDQPILHNDALFDPAASAAADSSDAQPPPPLRVTLYPEEQLLPLPNYVSSLLRDPASPVIRRTPFLIAPVPAASAKKTADDEQQKTTESRRGSIAAAVVPIPVPSTVLATLIANQSARKFSSPLWLRANLPDSPPSMTTSSNNNKNTAASIAPAAAMFDWLTPESLLALVPRRAEVVSKSTADSSSEAKTLVVPPLPPPPFSLLPYTSKEQMTDAPSLLDQYQLHNEVAQELVCGLEIGAAVSPSADAPDDKTQREQETAAVKHALAQRVRQLEQFVAPDLTRSTEASEAEAISLRDVPHEVARAAWELRGRPAWLKDQLERILSEKQQQDGDSINNFSNGKKKSKSPTAKQSIKCEIFVLGLFGPERNSRWRRVQCAHSAAAARASSPEDLLFVTLPFLRHVCTTLDYSKLAHLVDAKDLDEGGLDAFLHTQRVSLLANSVCADPSADNGGDRSSSSSTASLLSAARGMGPLRKALESHLAKLQREQRLRTARFSRWHRTGAFCNADQLRLWLELKRRDRAVQQTTAALEQKPTARADATAKVAA
jgi:hypothetical protein